MKIALLEFIDEFDAFLKFLEKNRLQLNDFEIVALEPRLQAYLKARGNKYTNTISYFDNGSHKKIIVATERIMNHIRENFEFIDGNGLNDSYVKEFAHYIRLYLNHIMKVLELLENIYKKDERCEIFACIGNRFSPSPMIMDSERYAGKLAEIFAKKRELKFTGFTIGKETLEGKINSKKRFRMMEKIFALGMLFCLKKKRIFFISHGSFIFNKLINELYEKDRSYVFLGIDYTSGLLKSIAFNMVSFFRALFMKKLAPYYLINADFINKHPDREEIFRLSECIDSLIRPINGTLFEYNGIDYHILIETKINAGLKRHMLALLVQSKSLKYIFKKTDRKIVMSFSALGIMSLSGELSRKMGIRSLFISHGSHPVPVDFYHEIELLNLCRGFMLSKYTDVALSNPVQEAHLHYFKGRYDWVENSEIKTGPLIFTDLKGVDRAMHKKMLGFSPEDIVVTHATTTKLRCGERYYFLETLDEFFSSLSDVVESVEKSKSIRLIVRIHPGFYLKDNEIKALLPVSDKFIIHREGSFRDVLAATDILISYSSTTIDEALINKIPVLLYDKWNRYNHFKTGVFYDWQSPDIFPVCYVNDKTKLERSLQYLTIKCEETKNEEIDVSRYCYNEDYRNNFYEFIEESLK